MPSGGPTTIGSIAIRLAGVKAHCLIDLRVPKRKDLLLQVFIQWKKKFSGRFYPAGNGCGGEFYVLAFKDLYLAVDGQAIDELTDDQLGQ